MSESSIRYPACRGLNAHALRLGGGMAGREAISALLLDEAVSLTEGADPSRALERVRVHAPRIAREAARLFEATTEHPGRVLANILLSVTLGMGLAQPAA